jgi:hypothetical protein
VYDGSEIRFFITGYQARPNTPQNIPWRAILVFFCLARLLTVPHSIRALRCSIECPRGSAVSDLAQKASSIAPFRPMRSICLVLDWILSQSKNRKVPLYQGLRHLTGRAFEPQQSPPSCFCSENTPIPRAPEPRLFRSSGVLQSPTNKPQQPLPVFGLAPTAHIRNPQSTSARSPSEPRSLSPRYPPGAPYDGLSFLGARSYTMQTVPLG